MAYYNPYTQLANNQQLSGVQDRTGGDFLKDMNFKMQAPRQVNPSEIQSTQPNPYQQQSFMGQYGNGIAAGVGQIANSLSQPNTNPNDFSVDPFAGYKGSGQGLLQGGVIGAIAGGIAGQVGTWKNAIQNVKNVNTGVNVAGVDPVTGRPLYNGQNVIDANKTMGALDKGAKKAEKSYDPLNFVINGFSGLSRKARGKRAQLGRSIQVGKDDYNRKAETFNQQELAMAQYNEMVNNQSRLRNLYSIGTKLY